MEKDLTVGKNVYNLAKKIYPYHRCLMGKGVEDTLYILKEYVEKDTNVKFEIKQIASGTKVFDWEVPKEWEIKEAYISDEKGNHIIDIKNNNLYVVGYSTSVDRWVDLEELNKYIYTQKDQPEAIPYVTSYYKERYGFCMSENQRKSLTEQKYHMYINSSLFNGNLTYGEVVIPGERKEEIFFSTYVCHPSMANDNCSGPALAAELIKYIYSVKNRKYTYRFIFVPETIGSISYMSINDNLRIMKERIIAGFNITCVGDDNCYSIVKTRYENTLADKVITNVLKNNNLVNCIIYPFTKRGSDERQYNAPGIDLPVVCFCRSLFHEFKEYHTSLDDMNYISPEGFQGSFRILTQVIEVLENNEYYKINVLCEPQLGKRNLYPTISKKGSYDEVKAMTDFIVYADGTNDLIDISNIIGVDCMKLIDIVRKLFDEQLIVKVY